MLTAPQVSLLIIFAFDFFFFKEINILY